jgi:DNA-binding XRE family transcriptional regulator
MELKTYLDQTGLTQAAFAAKVGTTHATISRLIAGKFRPSLALATAIERETCGQVRAVSWTSEAAAA